MKIICTQDNFKKAILNAERVVSKQNTLPILNNILFKAEKGVLKLSATNLEIGMIIKLGAKIEEEGEITIPAKPLGNFINNLSSGDNITLELKEQGLKIKSGKIKAFIKGLPAGDFPLIPQKKNEYQLELKGNNLKNTISKIISSVAFNESRQELTGVNLTLKEKELFFAATDSFRLAEEKLTLTEENVNKESYKKLMEKRENIIIPGATLVELARIINNEESPNIKIIIEEGQIFFESEEMILVSRLINGKYPEYRHIMPKEYKTRIVGEKNQIQTAIKMASVFSSSKTSEIVLKISQEEKKTVIEAKSVEVGENSTELDLDITGPSQEALFNSRYFLDGLNAVETSKAAILLNNGSSPVAIKEIDEKTGEVLESFTYIVMPIKN